MVMKVTAISLFLQIQKGFGLLSSMHARLSSGLRVLHLTNKGSLPLSLGLESGHETAA